MIRYKIRCGGCGTEATSDRFVGPQQYALCPECETEGVRVQAGPEDAPFLPANPKSN